MEKLKIGLIGCGGMMGTHARAVNQVEGVEIVAICDIIRSNAEEVARIMGTNPMIFEQFEDLTDYVDAVLIALPHDLHYECGMYFANKKKHILMEKPLCNSEQECLNLIHACEENGVTLMCAYPVRFWPGVVKLKELLDSGEYGRPIQMSIWTEQDTHPVDADGRINWANSSRLGGGQFFSHGCHYVDIMLWFLGEPVKGIHFGTRVGTEYMIGEGTSSAIMYFKNGAIGYHGATWAAKGTRLGYDFQIQTEKGLLEYDHRGGQVRIYDAAAAHVPGQEEKGPKERYRVVWDRGSEGTSKNTQFEIAHFVECVRTGKEPLTNGYSTLQGLRAIWRMYDAERTGRVADLSDLAL